MEEFIGLDRNLLAGGGGGEAMQNAKVTHPNFIYCNILEMSVSSSIFTFSHVGSFQ